MPKASLLSLLTLCLVAPPTLPAQDAPSADPDSALLITSDIDNFWRAYDAAQEGDPLVAYLKEYFVKGSPGLRDFIHARIHSVMFLVETIDARAEYYRSLRKHTDKVARFTGPIRESFHRLAELYPDAVFPDVYFLVGRMSSGGTTSRGKLLIGVEMYGLYDDTPTHELSDWHKQVLRPMENLPLIVAHELIHYQQSSLHESRTLLAQSIHEGSADFLSEIIAGGHINEHVHEYGDEHERALWKEFRAQMNGTDSSDWLYNANRALDRPADLGYYMGYKIAEAYYDRAADKKQAVREILLIEDYDGFLQRSGYGDQFE